MPSQDLNQLPDYVRDRIASVNQVSTQYLITAGLLSLFVIAGFVSRPITPSETGHPEQICDRSQMDMTTATTVRLHDRS